MRPGNFERERGWWRAGALIVSAAMLSGLLSDPPDKVLQVLIAALLYRTTPAEFIAMLRTKEPEPAR